VTQTTFRALGYAVLASTTLREACLYELIRGLLLVSPLVVLATAAAAIPAAPLMVVYQFDGPASVPYYDVDRFLRSGPTSPAGTLAQGTSVIPCLVVRGGQPVTDEQGTPYVGFEVVVDARSATPASTAHFAAIAKQRTEMTVANHHCAKGAAYVIDVRKLITADKAPRFEPPRSGTTAPATLAARGESDAIVRAFHASPACAAANDALMGRRDALRQAWDAFIAANLTRWPPAALARARNLDYALRTALYEGHLDRGCSAYGACERNVIALSIRNRGRERCLRGQGCRSDGDFEGVASTVSQYNIWDEYLTQTSGLTSCFLRPDLAADDRLRRLQAMYEQSVGDVERILYGDARDLQAVFPGVAPAQLAQLRHYYHPPAMGRCFADQERLEYISGAVAQRGDELALIANTRVRVDERRDGGYLFRQAIIEEESDRDVIRLVDRYPGFVIDGRKIELRRPSRCTPYGTPPGCRFAEVRRLRKTPSWLAAGEPLQLTCRVRAGGEDCSGSGAIETVEVGGVCDTRMQPIAAVQ
jgi:hypothetical protein